MLRQMMALAYNTLAAELTGKEAPTELRLFRKGINKTTKGDFLFDDKAAKAVMNAFEEYGNDLSFDYAHAAVPEKGARPQDQIAAGWFKLEVREGELWAVDIKWTDAAKTAIEAKEWRYVSPWFYHEEKSGRILEIINVALTNTPATHDAMPLVASDRRTECLAGFRATQRALEETLRKRYVGKSEWDTWVAEVYDDSVVFGFDGKLWLQDYQLRGLTAILIGDAVQVEITYKPVETEASRQLAATNTVTNYRTTALGSFQDVISALTDALTKRYPDPNGWQRYPEAVYDTTVVFRHDGRCWQHDYHMDGNLAVLDGDRVEVEVNYTPVAAKTPASAVESNKTSQSHAAAAARASAKENGLMDKAFLAALGLAETAPETEALAKLTRLTANMGELCKLTGKDTADEALGVVGGWKSHAEQLPVAQAKIAELANAGRKAEVEKILDGATTKVTPAMRPSLLSARPFDRDEDVAWLKAHVEALPTVTQLSGAPAAKPDTNISSDPAAAAVGGKKWEELSAMEKHNLYFSNKATYDALKADHAARQGK